jgi:hypothetical protein
MLHFIFLTINIMNPQTRKTSLDNAKFRENYLSNLRLQASNNQFNQNANMVMTTTGQPPQRPTDMRTTTERAQDAEGMKVMLRSKLSSITDGTIASQIIGELTLEQVKFALNNWVTIESDMKRQFALGVPSSAFISYLNRLIQKFQLTDGVETGLQQASGNDLIMSNTQILYGLPRQQVWSVLRSAVDRVSRQFDLNVGALQASITENEKLAPTQEEMQLITALPKEKKADIINLLNQVYNNVITNKDISDFIGELNVGLVNRDRRYSEAVLERLLNAVALDDSMLEEIEQARILLKHYANEDNNNKNDDSVAIENETTEEPEVLEEPEPTPPPKGQTEPVLRDIGANRSSTIEQRTINKAPRNISVEDWSALGTRQRAYKALFLQARLEANPDMILQARQEKPFGIQLNNLHRISGLTNPDLDTLYRDYMEKTDNGVEGEGLKKGKGRMKGKGIAVLSAKVSKPYRQSIAHLVDTPVYEKPKVYTQFGRYFINKHRLHAEGIVALRVPSGNTIPNFPAKKVSPALQETLKAMVGKGMPTYAHIADLSDKDKDDLEHICKTCRVELPSLPRSKFKGDGEKEDGRFNILRGEIIAGNGNPKIVKELKVLLMKFMNQGRIPKREANEVLHELLAMGH